MGAWGWGGHVVTGAWPATGESGRGGKEEEEEEKEMVCISIVA